MRIPAWATGIRPDIPAPATRPPGISVPACTFPGQAATCMRAPA
jgi:hypothetical protein